ncbi:SMP-30/gluconolactonase/LRE family protein [Bosea sp. PAMC 26642]|uniref:SMP-30/gluconolactonase/LRE family protein n=1 Tax=Bosea sp. (strain PAMC 26642) TaxID=1792307 RepID=UPI000770197F|nr:SMP-30/gluconolactonase/LRE family protein [Bosea sp. PAMC 26642]AMJ61439.1 gluconolaconase [Bosea sp. PAMC 26642]
MVNATQAVLPAPVLLGETRCHLGEGPAYDAATDTAFWFDILERRLFEVDFGIGAVATHELPLMASALAAIDENRQIVATESGLYLRERRDGALTLFRGVQADDATTRSNDAGVHPGGAFWFSMMSKTAEHGAASIYALSGGQVVLLFEGLTIPNTICFSADGTQGFFSDTARKALYRVPLDPMSGLPTDAPTPLRLSDGGEGLDGAAMDSEGLIWVARWGGSRIDALTGQGEIVRSLAVPARQPSCPVFVGRAFDRLMVTSAQEGQDEAARAADPQGGATFVLTPGAVGRAQPRVRLGAH